MKLLLNRKKTKDKRVKLADTCKHFTAEDWSRVTYLDESTVKCIWASRCKVRRRGGGG
jgi:hypothetical protein